MATHTAGPWIGTGPSHGDPLPRYIDQIIADREEEGECKTICYMETESDDEEIDANARLIAAAPELYDALRELLTDMVIAQGNMRKAAKRDPAWEGCAEIIQPRVDAARAAIAKAEGKLCGITSKNADIVQTGDTAGHTGGK